MIRCRVRVTGRNKVTRPCFGRAVAMALRRSKGIWVPCCADCRAWLTDNDIETKTLH